MFKISIFVFIVINLNTLSGAIIRCTGDDWQSCIDNASCNDAVIVSSDYDINLSILDNKRLKSTGFVS